MKFENLIGDLVPLEVRLTHSKAKMRKRGWSVGEHDAMTCWHSGENRFDVYIKPNIENSWIQDAGLLAHEAVHVMQGYFDALGEEEPGDEMQAYIVQAVSQYLWEKHFDWKERRMSIADSVKVGGTDD